MVIKQMAVKRVKREEPEHISFVQWFKLQYPDVMIIHNPNGESRGQNRLSALITGVKLKKMGVLAGVYDLFIPEWFLWIEMKPKTAGYLSHDQKTFRDHVEKIGYQTMVANGWEDGVFKLKGFLAKI